jgi:hypothetical protein
VTPSSLQLPSSSPSLLLSNENIPHTRNVGKNGLAAKAVACIYYNSNPQRLVSQRTPLLRMKRRLFVSSRPKRLFALAVR